MARAKAPNRPLEFTRPHMPHRLAREGRMEFDETATEEERAALATLFDARSVDRFRFRGHVDPLADGALRLEGRLDATVIQSCVVTLQPVTARISEEVRRLYLPDLDPEQVDFDADEEDEVEAMPRTLDLGLVAIEAAALALPAYPRAEEAEQASDAAPQPDAVEGERPFAALAALKEKLGGGS